MKQQFYHKDEILNDFFHFPSTSLPCNTNMKGKKERNKARVSTNATISNYTTEYLKLSYISYHILTELAYKTSSNLVKGKIFELNQNKQ